MKSPFPGMNPYLEKYWREVHQRLVIYAGDQLQSKLPPELRARIEERVFVETESGFVRTIYPDVHIVEHPQPSADMVAPAAGIATEEEPLLFLPDDEPLTQGYIEILDAASGNRVVTVIEFLSPSNKVPGEGQNQYLQKQRETRLARASLVEIDLTRAGRRTLALPPDRIPASYRTTYQVCVLRNHEQARFELYRAPLMRRLPTIRVPLRPSDADVALDLQALIDQCYANGRYDDLDYRSALTPPLEADEAALVDDLLRANSLR